MPTVVLQLRLGSNVLVLVRLKSRNVLIDEFFIFINPITKGWKTNSVLEVLFYTSNSSSYFSTIKKISQSDVVIVDASVYSMTMGNIVSYALSMKKSCLLLAEEIDGDPQDLFIAGNESPLLQYKIYNQGNLEKIVSDFVKNNSQVGNVRLNFVLDKDVSNRLDWLTFRTKLSKTEIVRRAINSYDPDIDN